MVSIIRISFDFETYHIRRVIEGNSTTALRFCLVQVGVGVTVLDVLGLLALSDRLGQTEEVLCDLHLLDRSDGKVPLAVILHGDRI